MVAWTRARARACLLERMSHNERIEEHGHCERIEEPREDSGQCHRDRYARVQFPWRIAKIRVTPKVTVSSCSNNVNVRVHPSEWTIKSRLSGSGPLKTPSAEQKLGPKPL